MQSPSNRGVPSPTHLHLFRKWTSQTIGFSVSLFFPFHRVFSINTYLWETDYCLCFGNPSCTPSTLLLLRPLLTPPFLGHSTPATSSAARSAPSWSQEERTWLLPPPLLYSTLPSLPPFEKKSTLRSCILMHFSVAQLTPFPSSPWPLGNHIPPFRPHAYFSLGPFISSSSFTHFSRLVLNSSCFTALLKDDVKGSAQYPAWSKC